MASDIGSVTKEMTSVIDNANQIFEHAWSLIADTAKMVGSTSLTNYAVSRTISYNPQNRKAIEVNPSIQQGTQKLFDIITKNLSELQNDTNNVEKWILVGKCYLLLGDFTNAYSSFAHVLRINPNVEDRYFWYSIACVYYHFKFYDGALQFFMKVEPISQGFPLYYDYHLRLAILYRSLEKTNESLREFDIVAKCPPPGLTEDDINFQKSFTILQSGNTEQAVKDFQKFVGKYPNNLKIIQQYTWTLSFMEKSALDEAQKLINMHPEFADDPLLKFVQARIALKSSDMETAYDKYCDCINDWCESPVFWCGLGVLYFKNDQYKDALVAFQRALYQKAEIAEAWLNLGFIYEEHSSPADALKLYEAGKQNCPKNQKLIDRYNRLKNPGRAQTPTQITIEEIKDSKLFTQVGDLHAYNITLTPPPIPGLDVAEDKVAARAIEELRVPYESLFVESQ